MQAVIVGFNPVGGIILNGVSATAISYTSGDLKLQTSTGTLDLGITGSHSLSDFRIVAGPDVTAIDAALPCLAAGTRVATDHGDVLVEQLRVGDIVMTGDGQLQAIQWIGHRDTDCGRHPDPRLVWPVRIAAHAFGHGLPRRAVLLSPDHAVFIDGVLVPIKHLINGTTIVQHEVARVTYYHVELPRHDVMLAEGLPVESYLETGNRTAFENGGGVMQLHPHFAPDPVRSALIWDSEGYAPLVVAPAQLAPIKDRLRRQAEALEVARKGRRRGSKAA
jgi:Hint domain